MSSGRDQTLPWVFDALKALGGKAQVIEVAAHIWDTHSTTILANRKLLLTWQYEMRWAANQLRRQGVMNPNTSSEPWSLSATGMRKTSL